MEEIMKEVYFHLYCSTCSFSDTPEYEDPCDECLENASNAYSHKPVRWKEKIKIGKKSSK